ncbi:alpha-ketoglutarate-dependent dioxygenase alkB homolog 7, mitochondrial [Corvus hawaiiensis]|uniref:alpha-ketoglutarate-dependent dioxygenase alkB homolog 7, mitochondrial n=1 Tax=Corvus hawaiiensis TaxID=134902 RepID=UPI002018809E|nr:alpha-ketoglutarate-dependent dioxygenase alkB homolog 7, mitochondrial [Corvus hawaiiensis]
MHRARGLWRGGVAATLGGSRAISGVPGAASGCPGAGLGPEAEADPALLRASSPEVARRLRGLALVRGGFVSEEEAAELLREVEPGLGRGRYQNDHWDRAITGYRETERGLRGGAGRALLLRVTPAFPPRRPPRPSAHVLDLLPGGRVGPHVDSVKFCGCTIAGVSLLSPSVLRLRSLQDPQDWLELLLEPGSLYVLRAAARYEFTHEILPDEESFFGGLRVPRGRRVALIFRNDPSETPPDPLSDLPVFIEDTQDSPPPK